jgi:hypothetical protein
VDESLTAAGLVGGWVPVGRDGSGPGVLRDERAAPARFVGALAAGTAAVDGLAADEVAAGEAMGAPAAGEEIGFELHERDGTPRV